MGQNALLLAGNWREACRERLQEFVIFGGENCLKLRKSAVVFLACLGEEDEPLRHW